MAGVLSGSEALELFKQAKQHGFALPAVNVIGTNTVNAALETAREVNSPIIIQFSGGGAQFYAGKSLDNSDYSASVTGAISGALHVHAVAKLYGVDVILHTDHAARKLLPWVNGMVSYGETFYKEHGTPLFTSHMLDLSEEPVEENIATSKEYLKRMSAINMNLEIELGVTGGEEDGVDNTDIDASKLYTQPSEITFAYEELNAISPNFMVAAAFGNVHGVYKPGNVKLTPTILKDGQAAVVEKFATGPNPIHYVFHGGSGSTREEIREAISYGVIKMNIDTDTQWAFWDGIRDYYNDNKEYLQTQLGNPEGPGKPNKKFYDPRKWLRVSEVSFKQRLTSAFEDLNAMDANSKLSL